MSKKYKEFKEKFDAILKDSNQVYLVTHKVPDGDAISSILSVYYYVTKVLGMPKSAIRMLITGPYDSNWVYFTNFDKVEFVGDVADTIQPNSTVVYLDNKDLNMFTNSVKDLQSIGGIKTICVDHHAYEDRFKFDLSYTVLKPTHTSTAEIIYSIFYRDILDSIPIQVGELILLGIYQDTGGFKYIDGYQADSLLFSSEIIKSKNICPEKFLSTLYLPKVSELNAEAAIYKNLSQYSVEGWPDFVAAYMTKKDSEAFSISDISGARGAIKDRIKYSAEGSWSFLFTPDLIEKTWNFSFRASSRGGKTLKVKDIVLPFGGGGHDMAAGMTLKGEKYWGLSAEEILKFILEHLKNTKPTYIE